MTDDYRETHLYEGKGREYQAVFQSNPYRRMLWQFEQRALDRILKGFRAGSAIRHLDFACGTGRILGYLSDRTTERTGVDLSPSMLEVAREENQGSEFLEADITTNDVLGERKFDLITAFRFFPNAQPELRKQAMQVLSGHLAEGGRLVFNNHKNTGSTRNRLARLAGRRDFKGMSLAEAKALVEENGLTISELYAFAIFPGSERHPLLPIPLLRLVESVLSRIGVLRPLGENLIIVCRRASSAR